MSAKIFDVIIVGGGPAGLTCALVLGRCSRSVLVFDAGTQRNRVSEAMHAFPSRDGERPAEFLKKIHVELSAYGITVERGFVEKATRTKGGFEVFVSGKRYGSKLLLLATGLHDELPPLPGIGRFYGKGVFHCPYCDGWEHRDEPWMIYAPSRRAAVEVSLRMTTWTKNVTLLAAYTRGLSPKDIAVLRRNSVRIQKEKVKAVHGNRGQLSAVEFENGIIVKCSALVFSKPASQQSQLAKSFGCEFNRQGQVRTNRLQLTCVPGLYAAGDMARDMELVIIAAAEGAKAAVAMNAMLNKNQRRSSSR